MIDAVLPDFEPSKEELDLIEKHIIEVLKAEIYLPILEKLKLNEGTLKNSIDDVTSAIRSGRIYFHRGQFGGKITAQISKELKRLGAEFSRKKSAWVIPINRLPADLRSAIVTSEYRMNKTFEQIDKFLSDVVPEQIAAKIKVGDLFDKALFKMDKRIGKNIAKLTIQPIFTDKERDKITKEYDETTKLSIKKFTQKQTEKLRKDMKANVLAGKRFDTMIETIKSSYGVSHNKAKFIAKQETKIMTSKLKEIRYTKYGAPYYAWKCVTGTALHPVRKRHRELNDLSAKGMDMLRTGKYTLAELHDKGLIFRWDDPPVSTEEGQPKRKNNPQCDYNCRCMALPLVELKK
jgi:uncharacterized protein YfeS